MPTPRSPVIATELVQTKEGALIEAARKRLGLSQREAARRAGVSSSQWRFVESGVRLGSDGWVSVRGKSTVLAIMARVVELPPEKLVRCRPDVAREMWYAQIGGFKSASSGQLVGLLVDLRDLFGEDVFNESIERIVQLRAQTTAKVTR